jgi:hypothetical protein
MRNKPSIPQFIVVPKTGIQICHRIPLQHIDLLPDSIKQAIWNAADKIGVDPSNQGYDRKISFLVNTKKKGAAANILLPLVAKYIHCDEIESTGWLACDETNAAFFRLIKINSLFHVDVVVDTFSGAGAMVSNRIPCFVSFGTALLKRDQGVVDFYVEDYKKPRSVVGTLVVDYGNSGCSAIFCPDDAGPGSSRAISIATPFDLVAKEEIETDRSTSSILKSTMVVLWAPESEFIQPWIVYGKRAEQIIGSEDPLITSLYAPKKYVRDWPENLKAHEPTTRFRGILGQRDGLFPKRLFVQHSIDQLLELILSNITNPKRSSVSPEYYPQVRQLLLTYPLTWRQAEIDLFKRMFSDAASRLFQQDDEVYRQFTVETVCSEPVAVATYAMWEHLFNYSSYGRKGQNLIVPSLASSTLGNLKGERKLRMLLIDIGGGSTDISLLEAKWDMVESQTDIEHVGVDFTQAESARFNRAGDRISHLIATAIYEYMRVRYKVNESLDFDAPSTNPSFTLNAKRNAVSVIMNMVEDVKRTLSTTSRNWRLENDDVLRSAFQPVINFSEESADEKKLNLEISLGVLKQWVERDRRARDTNGEPGFMDIFVYLAELSAQCRQQSREINLVILSGRTTRLPFIREFACEMLGIPWHRIRTIGDLIPDGLKTSDHLDADKLAVVHGGLLFKNGGPIRFKFNTSIETKKYNRFIGIVSDTPGGLKIGKSLVRPRETSPQTCDVIVPANGRVRIGQAFREDATVEILGILQNTSSESKEVSIEIKGGFDVTLKPSRNLEGVTYTEWVSGGVSEIRDNFNDTGRIDAEPVGFMRSIVLANQDEWIKV